MTASAPDRLLYLCAADVLRAGGDDPGLFLAATEEALRAQAAGDVVQPLKPYLRRPEHPHPSDRIIAMPAFVGGSVRYAGMKWVGSASGNALRELPRASALIVLNDPDTNRPVAILDGARISAYRTAAASAIACRYLAPAGRRVTFLGAGVLARAHLELLVAGWTRPDELRIVDPDLDRAVALAAEAADRHGVAAWADADPENALAAADVIVAVTTAAEPWIPAEWVPRGSTFLNISLVDPLPDVVLSSDLIVLDSYEQAVREGKLLHLLEQQGRFGREDVAAELADLVTGRRPGRTSPEQTVFVNPIGQAILDVACAAAVHDRARELGVGTWVDR